MWVRRAALVATLPWTKARHPTPAEARRPRPHPRLGRGLRRRPRLVHPEGRRLVAAQPRAARPRPRPRLPRRPGPRPQALRPPRGRAPPLARRVDQPDADAPHRGADPVGHPELQADPPHVRVHGVRRDAEDVADHASCSCRRATQPSTSTSRSESRGSGPSVGDQDRAIPQVRQLADPVELAQHRRPQPPHPPAKPSPQWPSRPFGP